MVKVKRDSREIEDDISRVVEDTIFDVEYWEGVYLTADRRRNYDGRWIVNPVTGMHSVYARPMFELKELDLPHSPINCPGHPNDPCQCWEGVATIGDHENECCWASNEWGSCAQRAIMPHGLCVEHRFEIIGPMYTRMENHESSMGNRTLSVWRIPRFSDTN